MAEAQTAGGSGATQQQLTPEDVAALTKLKADHMLSTDVIVTGDIDGGLAVYREIFTPDAEFVAGFDEASPLMSASGLDAWNDAVVAGVADSVASHHHAGVLSIEPGDGPDTARIACTFQAIMFPKAAQTMTIMLGTYHDDARRIDGRWWLTRSFAKYVGIHSGNRDAP